MVGGRERERGESLARSHGAQCLFSFSLTRSLALAITFLPSPLRSRVKSNYAFSFRPSPSPYAPTLSPTHMTQITSRGLLPSSNLANHPFGLVAEVAQASTIHQPLSGHHVTPPFYIRTRAYLWKKNDALVVHAT